MTEEEIMQVITCEGRFDDSQITDEDLIRSYAACLANICGQVKQLDFIRLMALTALVYKKSLSHAAQARRSMGNDVSAQPRCPTCGK